MITLKNRKLFIISPHPDDEVLGCGGLIKKIKDNGGKVYVLFVTVGNANDYSEKGASTGKERMKEIEKVAKFLKYDDYRVAFAGNKYHLRLDTFSQLELMNEFENGLLSLNKIKPDIVACPLLSDYNQDHRSCTMAVFGAARPAPETDKPLQRVILGYESVPTAGWWDTTKESLNTFLHLTEDELEAKLKALNLYKSQVRSGNHSRSIESMRTLAKFRGIECGHDFAEAFYTYRIVI